jgi:membrane protein EpsK
MTSSDALLGDSPRKDEVADDPKPGAAHSHFAVNVASNVAYTLMNTVANMWFTPFLITHLGVATFGLVPLVTSITSYMTLFTGGLSTAVSRFLTIDLNQGDESAANRTFNTAIWGLIGMALALLPVGFVAAWLFPTVFQVPAGSENDARLLFGFSVLAFLISVIGSSFTVSTFASHRFDLSNLVLGMRLVARLGVVIFLFQVLAGRLWHVGLGILVAAAVSLGGYWLLWRRLTPQLHFNLSQFDRARLRGLVTMGGWSVVNQIGLLLILNVNLVVVNAFFGAEMTGRYGTLILFPTLMTTLAVTMSSVLNPVIVARYARKDFEGLRHLASQSVKLIGISMALPIGLLCGFARPLLIIWLGSDFQDLDILLMILVGPLCVSLAALPLRHLLTSYNKVRVQGIFTVMLGVVGLGLAVALAHWGKWGIAGVAVATAIVWTARNFLFVTSYSALVMNLPWRTFYPPMVVGALGTVVVGLGAYGLTQIWWPENWFGLGLAALVVSLAYGVAAYYVGLNRQDRQLFSNLIREPVRKYRR